MASTWTATAIQLRIVPVVSLTVASSKLPLSTLNPMASVVSRPVTLPSSSSVNAPFTPTNMYRSLKVMV